MPTNTERIATLEDQVAQLTSRLNRVLNQDGNLRHDRVDTPGFDAAGKPIGFSVPIGLVVLPES